MKSADLEIVVQEGEGTTSEFKENLPVSLARDLVAMANTIGGRILLGVRDDGTVVGVKDSNLLQRCRLTDAGGRIPRKNPPRRHGEHGEKTMTPLCSLCLCGEPEE